MDKMKSINTIGTDSIFLTWG